VHTDTLARPINSSPVREAPVMSESAPSHATAYPVADHHAIENLIVTYTHLVDAGDFAGLDALLADATFTGSGTPVSGPGAIEKMFRDTVIVYEDGTPRTKHLATNIIINLEEDAGTAAARSYVTVLQAAPGFSLQTIAAGRYLDRFQRRHGQWRFTERRVHIDLVGDVSHHLHRAAASGDARSGA
jgi:ketosteroid isomerase-like protein